MESLESLINASLNDRTFQRLVLSQPRRELKNVVQKVTVRPIETSTDLQFQWTGRIGSLDKHETLSDAEFLDRVTSDFGNVFSDAHLFTQTANFTIRKQPGRATKFKRTSTTKSSPVEIPHNREKNYLIPAGSRCEFLIQAGVMRSDGQIRPAMYHKFRQINRYLEFVNDILPDLPKQGTLEVVDFGCGKSYLTFALHHLLTQVHRREVSIVGLDVKSDVIADCNRIADQLHLSGLHFEVGRIESYQPTGPVHLTVSLHACDTATDDALAAAVQWKSDVILAVPCCQHELNQVLGQDVLSGVTGYGLLRERFASMATDALRARFLDVCGYKTQILEFIDLEHTPKNVLIRAVRRSHDSPKEVASRQKKLDQLKADLKLETWHMERALKGTDR